MKLTELMAKDIINDDDGIKLGRVVDIELDSSSGKVISVTINKGFRFNSLFSSKESMVIPWQKIIKIGSDVIIVDYPKSIKKAKEINSEK